METFLTTIGIATFAFYSLVTVMVAGLLVYLISNYWKTFLLLFTYGIVFFAVFIGIVYLYLSNFAIAAT